MSADRLLERFLKYVAVETTADESTDKYPSSVGQFELGAILKEELNQLGLEDVEQDEWGLIYATLPSNVEGNVPVIAFNAHLDTSPETTAKDVKPQVIRDYQGGDIGLPGDPAKRIRVQDNPELDRLRGCTLITTDGTTLLGGDDKAGIAIIMEVLTHLVEDPTIKHGTIRAVFTCDEEIGRGIQHLDFEKLGADACYTFDGGGAGEIDVETFSADLAVITVTGVNIHPSIAKDRMVNALRGAGHFLDQLPPEMAPETTSGRDGFIHPYHIEGGVAEVAIRIILRDFDTSALETQKQILLDAAKKAEAAVEGVKVDVAIQKQYRNMGDGLQDRPEVVEHAVTAFQTLGFDVRQSIVRGGTDGCQMTEQGLPTPNLSSGQHNPHSPLEWACLDEMAQAVLVGIEISRQWAKQANL